MSRFPLAPSLLLIALTLAACAAQAQNVMPSIRPGAAPPAGAPAPAALTLKERLGAKWKDEQRVNNCNVPPEKRGSKPRPDACAKPRAE